MTSLLLAACRNAGGATRRKRELPFFGPCPALFPSFHPPLRHRFTLLDGPFDRYLHPSLALHGVSIDQSRSLTFRLASTVVPKTLLGHRSPLVYTSVSTVRQCTVILAYTLALSGPSFFFAYHCVLIFRTWATQTPRTAALPNGRSSFSCYITPFGLIHRRTSHGQPIPCQS